MDKRQLALPLGVLAIAFLVLNFTVRDAGTLFLLLAVACALGAAFLFVNGRSRAD